jgi:hypothetical protein
VRFAVLSTSQSSWAGGNAAWHATCSRGDRMRLQACAPAIGLYWAIMVAQFVPFGCTAGRSEQVGASSDGAAAEGATDGGAPGTEASTEETDGSMDDGADVELPFDICPDGSCGDAPGPGCGPGQSLYYTLPGCGVGPVCQSPTQGCTQAFCGCDGVVFIDLCGASARPFQVYSSCIDPDAGCPKGSCFVHDPSDASVCERPHDWMGHFIGCIGEGGSD